MHFRMPAMDHGFVSFLWGVGLGAFIWIGLLAVGVSRPTSFVVALLSAFGIFLFVRLRGQDRPRRSA
jgi:hypothetical protein